jgi:hypothetical protein
MVDGSYDWVVIAAKMILDLRRRQGRLPELRMTNAKLKVYSRVTDLMGASVNVDGLYDHTLSLRARELLGLVVSPEAKGSFASTSPEDMLESASPVERALAEAGELKRILDMKGRVSSPTPRHGFASPVARTRSEKAKRRPQPMDRTIPRKSSKREDRCKDGRTRPDAWKDGLRSAVVPLTRELKMNRAKVEAIRGSGDGVRVL